MSYYKIIDGGAVIDANDVYLRYQTRHGILLRCGQENGEFIQSSDGEEVYRAQWLRKPPEGAPEYKTVTAELIDEEEYNEIVEALKLGEEIPFTEAEEVTEIEEETSYAEEKTAEETTVMTADEMRRRIIELEEKIAELSEKLGGE